MISVGMTTLQEARIQVELQAAVYTFPISLSSLALRSYIGLTRSIMLSFGDEL